MWSVLGPRSHEFEVFVSGCVARATSAEAGPILQLFIWWGVPARCICHSGVWETLVDASFTLDILLNFRTAYIESGPNDILISSHRKIAHRYLLGFFMLDLISTVPWDLVMTNGALGLVQLFKVSRIIKLVRIMRVLKLIRILRLLKVFTYCTSLTAHKW